MHEQRVQNGDAGSDDAGHGYTSFDTKPDNFGSAESSGPPEGGPHFDGRWQRGQRHLPCAGMVSGWWAVIAGEKKPNSFFRKKKTVSLETTLLAVVTPSSKQNLTISAVPRPRAHPKEGHVSDG